MRTLYICSVIIMLLATLFFSKNVFLKKTDRTYDSASINTLFYAPPNIQLYEYMKKYAMKEKINLNEWLRLANQESSYRGYDDWTYKPFVNGTRVSKAGARGPLQVKGSTARDYMNVTNHELEYNIPKNVEASGKHIKYLRSIKNTSSIQVYSMYNQGWVGKNNINNYARKVTNIK